MIIFGVSFSATDIWLFGVCGSLIALFIRLRFASEIRNRDIFNNAVKEFTDAFHRELKEIYPVAANWPRNIDHYLRSRFDNLNEAVGKFKRHLPRRKQKASNDAWFRYYCCTGREVDRNCQCYLDYSPSTSVYIENGKEIIHDNTKTYKEDFKKNVDALLKFAKQR